jgi:hypothetical protein
MEVDALAYKMYFNGPEFVPEQTFYLNKLCDTSTICTYALWEYPVQTSCIRTAGTKVKREELHMHSMTTYTVRRYPGIQKQTKRSPGRLREIASDGDP